MSMVAAVAPDPYRLGHRWDGVVAARPGLAASAARYLAQIEVSLRPNTVIKTDEVLAGFCRHLIAHHPDVASFAEVGRPEIESFKLALASRLAPGGTPLKAKTLRVHLSLLKAFFARLVDWEWPEAPARIPIGPADMPRIPDPLPKALDDPSAARFLAAAAAETDQRRQLCVELLARTGMRVSELCGLEADAVSNRSGAAWLRIPVGKLHNDRYVPLHPRLVELLEAWARTHPEGARNGRLITKHGGSPLERHMVGRMVRVVARRAGVGHVHPHQLRHTLATQAINRGMRIEAVAELLGHRDISPRRRPRSTPSTPTPTTRMRRRPCAGCAPSTAACSATAGAPGHGSSTAASSRSARAAGSSPPALSSSPDYGPSAITPPPTARRPVSTYTKGSLLERRPRGERTPT
ncbi:MAG TPA: tyrosine-type recombinase/integrase, partial [Acidimicrobiales bacterium]|nr:tyrosine-type recombinase/integrase [Acidimicrobiales bacterium]